VLNKTINGVQMTIALYVDDLACSCVNEQAIRDVLRHLSAKYGQLEVHDKSSVPFLGMLWDFSVPDVCTVLMTGYIKSLLVEAEVPIDSKFPTPADDDFFIIDADSPLLPKDLAKKFHSRVQSCLYPAIRTRPDIATAVSFLSSRVTAPTQEDWKKLVRLLGYLNRYSSLGIRLEPNKLLSVLVYVDASYGVHADGRSHTGVSATLGKGPIFCRSGKQRIVTKSSTEAELVATSDEGTIGVRLNAFLRGQGYTVPPALIHQDNLGAMALLEKGRSTSSRTRHINIRYFFLKERIDAQEIKVVHLPTEDMVCDVLTKPKQGAAFRKDIARLMNWPLEDIEAM
jgi:hypothetical protein